MPQEKPVNVAKYKSFEVFPKSVEDAIDEMNMLEHDFYVFINDKTKKLQIVYRRNDGDMGILEPIIPKV